MDRAEILQANELANPAQPPANSAKIQYGKVIPPQQQILVYSSEEWESFVQEWATGKKPGYLKVVRLAGAADMGIDIAGLTEGAGFFGAWDNFQCKHYDSALTPRDALPEIGNCFGIRSRRSSRRHAPIVSWRQRDVGSPCRSCC